ncbi:MAG: rRNA maturation RNase YbeY [Bacteroidales bacterium]|nr:rRNA maturation RNase YbeY [Bacteroidales bacterium]
MPVKFYTEQTSYNLKNKIKVKNWIKNSISNENALAGDINIILTSDSYLLKINKEYLKHNYYTDIITFNYCEGNIINGDIYISVDTVQNNSELFNVSFIDELHRVIIHGILHLIGFDDKNDDQKKVMREKENEYLERVKNLL